MNLPALIVVLPDEGGDVEAPERFLLLQLGPGRHAAQLQLRLPPQRRRRGRQGRGHGVRPAAAVLCNKGGLSILAIYAIYAIDAIDVSTATFYQLL